MSLREVLCCVRNNSRVRLEVTKVVHAVNNLQVQRLLSLMPVEQWRWAHERSGVRVELGHHRGKCCDRCFSVASRGRGLPEIRAITLTLMNAPRGGFNSNQDSLNEKPFSSSRAHHSTAIEPLPLHAPRRRHAKSVPDALKNRLRTRKCHQETGRQGLYYSLKTGGAGLAGDVAGRPGESRSGAFESPFAGSSDSRNERTDRDVSLNPSYASLSTEESRRDESSCTVE